MRSTKRQEKLEERLMSVKYVSTERAARLTAALLSPGTYIT